MDPLEPMQEMTDQEGAIKPPKGFEDLSARAALATKIRIMIDDYSSSTMERAESWKRCQEVYDEKRKLSSLSFLDELDPYHVPCVKPRVDAIVSAVCDPISGSDPYFTVTSKAEGPDETAVKQQAIQYAFEQAGFDYKIRNAAFHAAMRGRGIMRLRYETIADQLLADSDYVDSMSTPVEQIPTSNEGQVQKAANQQVRYSGVVIDTIPPECMVVYPTYMDQIQKCVLVGHWLWQRRSDVVQKQQFGRYFQDIDIPLTQDATGNLPNGLVMPVISNPDDYQLLTYDLLIKIAPKDGYDRWYRVTMAYTQMLILAMEPYDLPTPWYFAPTFRYEPVVFWPARSIAEALMPLQTIYNDAWTLMIAGAASGSFTSAIVTGYPGESKNIRVQLGSILTLPQSAGVTPLPNRFDPRSAQIIIQEIPGLADSLSRISQAANAQDFSPSTTATAVNAVMAGQTAGISEFMRTFGLELERMADFALFLLQLNFDAFKSYAGEAIDAVAAEQLGGRFTVAMNGKNAASNAQTLMQKIMMFLQTMKELQIPVVPSQNPIVIDEIVKMVLNILDFPNDTKRLFSNNEQLPGLPGTGAGDQNASDPTAQFLNAILQAAVQHQTGQVPGGMDPSQGQGMPGGAGGAGFGQASLPSIPTPGANPGIPIDPVG